jgi:hypothetical protein
MPPYAVTDSGRKLIKGGPSSRLFASIFAAVRRRGEDAMRDADMVIVTRCSTFDHTLPDIGDLDPTNLDRLAASLDYLTQRFCEPGADETREPIAESTRVSASVGAGRKGKLVLDLSCPSPGNAAFTESVRVSAR